MPERREPEPYQPPTAHRGGVPDLSEVPTFLRRGTARPVGAPPSRADAPARTGASIRTGARPRGAAEPREAAPGPVTPPPTTRLPRTSPGRESGPARPMAGPRRPIHLGAHPVAQRPALDPAALPIPSLSRRRLGTIAAGLAGAWLVIAFGRQVGAASAATDRVQDLRLGNAALRQDVDALRTQLDQVTDPRYVAQAARGVRMGGRGEVPFTLSADAPSLAPGAPGSASTALGSIERASSPLEGWIEVLFGPRG